MATELGNSWKSTATLVVVVISAILWSIPLGINSMLVYYQYKQGTGSLFLLEIGVLPYAIGLLIGVLGPILLLRLDREEQALILAGVMLGLSLPAALIWWAGMGSV